MVLTPTAAVPNAAGVVLARPVMELKDAPAITPEFEMVTRSALSALFRNVKPEPVPRKFKVDALTQIDGEPAPAAEPPDVVKPSELTPRRNAVVAPPAIAVVPIVTPVLTDAQVGAAPVVAVRT